MHFFVDSSYVPSIKGKSDFDLCMNDKVHFCAILSNFLRLSSSFPAHCEAYQEIREMHHRLYEDSTRTLVLPR